MVGITGRHMTGTSPIFGDRLAIGGLVYPGHLDQVTQGVLYWANPGTKQLPQRTNLASFARFYYPWGNIQDRVYKAHGHGPARRSGFRGT